MLLANVCAGLIRFCDVVCGEMVHLGGFLGAPRGSVAVGCTSSAGLHHHVYRTRATRVCLSQDTLIGRRSAVALSS